MIIYACLRYPRLAPKSAYMTQHQRVYNPLFIVSHMLPYIIYATESTTVHQSGSVSDSWHRLCRSAYPLCLIRGISRIRISRWGQMSTLWTVYKTNKLTLHDPFLQTWINFDIAWASNYILYKVWDKITIPFPNINGTVYPIWDFLYCVRQYLFNFYWNTSQTFISDLCETLKKKR